MNIDKLTKLKMRRKSMIERLLERKNVAFKVKVTIKTIISIAMIAMSVILPQIVHLAIGSKGGVLLLPMYLPVLIGGCILGYKWGLTIGILSPLVSYLLTLAGGNPMPMLYRLPFMMGELGVFGLISGLMSNKIVDNPILAFPTVLISQVAGRSVFFILSVLFNQHMPITITVVYNQLVTGLLGICIQAVIVPIIVILLNKLCESAKNNE